MKLSLWFVLGAAVAVAPLASAGEASAFSGQWSLDLKRSSSISPWTQNSLTIKASDGEVEVDRALGWDDARSNVQVIKTKTDGTTVTSNPVKYWVETWFNNAYIGGDKTEKVRAQWLEVGKVLKVETNLTLNLQQGDRPVHVYDEYHLSADGQTLRVFEIRSTRDQSLSFVFTRQSANP